MRFPWIRRRGAAAADRLGLAAGERVLAEAHTTAGAQLVATDLALYHELDPAAPDEPGEDGSGPDGGGPDSFGRLGWETMARATWDMDSATLDVAVAGVPRVRHVFEFTEAGRLPEVVRERVTATIVVSQHVPLVGRQGVRIAARRRPGGRELHWTLTFDPGLDPNDAGLRAAAEQALTELRAATGP